MIFRTRTVSLLSISLLVAQAAPAAWVNLLNGKNLDGWEVIGEGYWNVMSDGTVVGQRDILKPTEHQCWLYTKKDFGEYDLHIEYWLRYRGNSGVSIRDNSRARYAVSGAWDAKRTPSHIGYEIQISNGLRDTFPSGSVYLFDAAKPGHRPGRHCPSDRLATKKGRDVSSPIG